jgi:hypothetical protein
VWLSVLLVLAALLVDPNDAKELANPNDFEEVTDWLVGKLTRWVQEASAEDLVQQALEHSMPRGKRPWARDGELSLAEHLVYVVSDLRRNEVRRKGFHVAEDPADDAPNVVRAELTDPETYAAASERHGRLYKDAVEHFRASPMVQPVLERIFLGRGNPSSEAHAAELGMSVKQMNNAKDRVAAFVFEWQEREAREEEAKRA